MPLCPQITNTPITVSLTADYTVTNVVPVLAATTTQVNQAQSDATSAAAAAAAAAAIASSAIQVSANTIVNASNQLTAINGTGVTVYSGASSTSGARVVLNSLGLAGYNSGGTATFTLEASTGNVSLAGALLSGGSITGTSINIPTSGSPAFSVNALGAMTATSGSIGGFTITSTYLGGSGGFTLNSNGQIDGGNSNSIFYGYANIGGGAATGARLIVAGTSELNGSVSALGSITTNGNLTVDGSATFGNATANPFQYLSSSGTLRSAYTYTKSITTGTPRAMLINSTGDFGTSASTRRKKHEIESYRINSNALLQLDVKTYKFKPEIDPTQQIQHGFIAEEAQELGLDELIQYDSTGIPDYFAYEKLPIFLLQLIQEQDARIKALEAQLTTNS